MARKTDEHIALGENLKRMESARLAIAEEVALAKHYLSNPMKVSDRKQLEKLRGVGAAIIQAADSAFEESNADGDLQASPGV